MTHITLAHGNGGKYMRQLIKDIFASKLSNPLLDIDNDAVTLPDLGGELVMTADGFTVEPLEFPGGNIGSLAVHGTVNDLAVSGAIPKYLSLSAILEEGLEMATLERIITSMAQAAQSSGVYIVCGDTKVVPRGNASGIYFSTTGIGNRAPGLKLGPQSISAGDCLLLSGPIGDHGTAVLLAREQFGITGAVQSDASSVLPLCKALHDFSGLRFMRDPTRGGLATVLNDICEFAHCGVRVQQTKIPVQPSVKTVCDILGYDPLYLACEGRVIAVVSQTDSKAALAAWRALPEGRQATIIGAIEHNTTGVVLETELGGERFLEALQDDPLPRIC